MDGSDGRYGNSFEFSEPESVPRGHPLHQLFRSVTRRAFSSFRGLYHPDVETHISDEILTEFVHVDRIYRIRDEGGRRLSDLSEMSLERRQSSPSRGVERDLEIHQHTGDFALFMAGLFPEGMERRQSTNPKPLLACIGSTMVSLRQPRDFYIVEGRSAYSHVSRLYERMESPRCGLFQRLSNRFEEYLDLLGWIRDYLKEVPGQEGEAGAIE